MEHRLNNGEKIIVTLHAKDVYSMEKLIIRQNETYSLFCDKHQSWKDWIIKTTPNGFYNILASIQGLRVKKVNCFCLCGAYNESDEGAFPIGAANEIVMKESGLLSFFANDTLNYYSNNKGCIKVHIERIN